MLLLESLLEAISLTGIDIGGYTHVTLLKTPVKTPVVTRVLALVSGIFCFVMVDVHGDPVVSTGALAFLS